MVKFNIFRQKKSQVHRFRNSCPNNSVDFFDWRGESPQEYIRLSRDFNEVRRKKAAEGLGKYFGNGVLV